MYYLYGLDRISQCCIFQSLSLGLFRSDYLMQCTENNSIKQVEFNTVAASFGAITSYLPTMSRYRHLLLGAIRTLGNFERYHYSRVPLNIVEVPKYLNAPQPNISHVAALSLFARYIYPFPRSPIVLRVFLHIFVWFSCLLHCMLCFHWWQFQAWFVQAPYPRLLAVSRTES